MFSGERGSGWLHKNTRQQKKSFLFPVFFEGTGCARGRSLILWRRSFTAWRDRTESFVTRRNRWSEKSSTSKIYWSRSTRLAVSGWNRTAVPKKINPHLRKSTKRRIKSRAPTGFCLTQKLNGSCMIFGSSFLKKEKEKSINLYI